MKDWLQEKINRSKTRGYKLLRWSEQYTKTDMVYLTKGMSWLTFGQFFASGSAFVLAILIANFLPQDTYGTYKFVLSIAGILGITTLPGMGTALIRSVARGFDGSLITVVKTRLSWGILSILGSLGVAGYYFIKGNEALAISFLIVSVFISFMEAYNSYGAFLEGKKLFGVSTKYFIISQLFAFTVMGISVVLTDNLFIILLAYFLPWTLSRKLFYEKSKKYIKNREAEPDTILYGKHLSLMNIIGTIAGNIDKILLFHFLGAAQVAIYFFTLAPVKQIRSFVNKISALALPKFAQNNISSIKKTVYGKMAKLLVVMVIITTSYIVVAPFIFKMFFPQYINAVFFSQMYALVLLVQPGMFLGMTFAAHAKKREMYIANILNPSVRIILYLILIPTFGTMGAVVAILLSEVVHLIINFTLFRKI